MAEFILPQHEIDPIIDAFDEGLQRDDFKLSAIAVLGIRHKGDEANYGHYAGILTGRIMQDFFDFRLPSIDNRIAALVAIQNIPECSGLSDILSGIILGFEESSNLGF